MVELLNVDLKTLTGKNLLFGFSLETGDLTSVQVVAKTSATKPSLAGWLKADYPDNSETEEFELADAYAWLAANAPGWGRITKADLTFSETGKLIRLQSL